MLFHTNDSFNIYHGDVIKSRLKPNSVDLIITSPPYNVSMDYGSSDDEMSYEDYLEFSRKWIKKCFSYAKDDGRFCLNIPLDKNKGGHSSVYADLVTIAKSIGWKYFTTIVWNEGNISRRTAWGSWMSASAPYVIAPVEMVAVFYKSRWKKLNKGTSDISRENFMEWTNGLWTFNGESKKRIGHPAPFPVELPKRCISLFSYKGDVVFDPFLGSGTTLVSAYELKRFGIGFEIDKSYCELSLKRIYDARRLL